MRAYLDLEAGKLLMQLFVHSGRLMAEPVAHASCPSLGSWLSSGEGGQSCRSDPITLLPCYPFGIQSQNTCVGAYLDLEAVKLLVQLLGDQGLPMAGRLPCAELRLRSQTEAI